jgi:hypothetical protein
MQNARWLSRLGLAAGVPLAPITAGLSALRHARMFHPRGTLLLGDATPAAVGGARGELAACLAGPVLVRFSGALWKRAQLPDVLGCALRFTRVAEPSIVPDPQDQDLLLATIRHPLTTLLAALTTDAGDYLRNDYFGVSPFLAPALGRVKLRLRPITRLPGDGKRSDRLHAALRAQPLLLRLDVRESRLGAAYEPLAYIELREVANLDQEGLRFDPFRAGRGLEPVGFVHHLRIAAYRGSQWARGHVHADRTEGAGRG